MIPGQSKRQKLLDETVTSPTMATKRKRVRGALRSLPDMPIDIICQIFYLLNPIDLLRIARTNKAFRRLLIVRKSGRGSDYACTSIWREARKNIPDLPEPFPGMSEPFYASLCFEPHCTICFKQSIHEVIWEFRARLCNECKNKKTRTSSGFETQIWGAPSSVALPLMNAQVTILGRTRRTFLESDITQLEEKWERLRDDGDDKKEQFIQRHKENIQRLEEHARRCSVWFSSKKSDRQFEIWKIKGQRCKNILDRLEELGYGPDIHWANNNHIVRKHRIEMLPAVRQGKPLTERVWENIRPEIVKHILTHIRPKRLESDYQSVLEDRIPFLKEARAKFAEPYGTNFPLVEDFARLPEVRAILDPSDGQHINIESFDALEYQIPEIIARWKDNVRDELDAFLRKKLSRHNIPSDLSTSILHSNLAIATLFCRKCHQIVQTSNLELAVHGCRTLSWSPSTPIDRYEPTLEKLELYPYSPSDFYVASSEVLEILQACGKDKLTTVQELDALNHVLPCHKGCDTTDAGATYGWRDLLIHSITNHRSPFKLTGSPLWEFISTDEDFVPSFSWDDSLSLWDSSILNYAPLDMLFPSYNGEPEVN
ncbi:hypothetical protein QCA50_013474 [Cerrena zonata]|uniref:F-box domain-containing protein n=1 Tax=Cerrena zonata TaxID=2478898 RepID=A0AAW0FS17_9APHY